MSSRTVVPLGLLALPLLGFVLLLAAPGADLQWEDHPAHFWLVLSAGVLSGILAYATSETARRRADARLLLVADDLKTGRPSAALAPGWPDELAFVTPFVRAWTLSERRKWKDALAELDRVKPDSLLAAVVPEHKALIRAIDRRIAASRGWTERWHTAATELRCAVRTLLRTPTFTIVAVVVLALGIGATTAILSLLKAIVLDPLPYPNDGRLVRL